MSDLIALRPEILEAMAKDGRASACYVRAMAQALLGKSTGNELPALTGSKLHDQCRELIGDAMRGIQSGFQWSKTSQGSDYWITVRDNLSEIYQNVEKYT